MRLDIKEFKHIIPRRYLTKKRKDLDARVRVRSILLVHEGKTLRQAGQILEVARATVEQWIKRHGDLGVTSLLARGPYQGKKSRLSLGKKRELAIMVRQGPEDRGLDTGGWTSPIIADLVKRRFGISYSPSEIRRVLHFNVLDKNSSRPMNCLRSKKVQIESKY
ncbi:MAG: helix-turn-helix domain-containing protein [Desulfomonilaceae bacterium]